MSPWPLSATQTALVTMVAVVGYLGHELTHYAVARLLGCRNVSLHYKAVSYEPPNRRVDVVVHLAPAYVGFVLLAGFLTWYVVEATVTGRVPFAYPEYAIAAAIAWFWGSLSDWQVLLPRGLLDET